MSEIGEITRLLSELAKEGADQRDVLRELVPLVYGRLKALARVHRYRWQGPTALGTTSLVHEAYARLARQTDASYANRRQFLYVASKAMRSILIDNARWHLRLKRGGGREPVPLQEELLVSEDRCEELLALDEALGRLDDREPLLARVVECRCFGGLTTEETAEALDISPATVKRRWSLAHTWLYRELRAESG
jgi:RNA polymerase sigma factor (TIGR02999 family)